jgi:hypothetical protein
VNENVIVIIIVLITVLVIVLFEILRMHRRLRKAAAEPEPTMSDLGYEFVDFEDEDPTPFVRKITNLHGYYASPVPVYKKQVPEGEIYMYMINTKPGATRSGEIRIKITLVSPSLNLPHLSIAPISKQTTDKRPGVFKIIKSIFSTDYSRKDLTLIQLGIDEEFENTHVIQANDEAKAREFLTRSRLEQLKSLRRNYILKCNETDFSIDDPAQEEQDWKYLVQTARDAQTICRILSSD